MEFIDIVGHGYQEDFRQNLFAAPKQELPEPVILLDDPKGALRLNGMVHPKQDTLFAGDALQRLPALLNELL
jgi:hypothetical protein